MKPAYPSKVWSALDSIQLIRTRRRPCSSPTHSTARRAQPKVRLADSTHHLHLKI